ncbi:MAG: hypothetical protein KAJ48_04775 [Elusimicrobiales bacterium]|nr:hypothetical protein [Elusimicrobiales bacterium]
MNKIKYNEIQFKTTKNSPYWNINFSDNILPFEKMKKKADLYRKANPDKIFRIIEISVSKITGKSSFTIIY